MAPDRAAVCLLNSFEDANVVFDGCGQPRVICFADQNDALKPEITRNTEYLAKCASVETMSAHGRPDAVTDVSGGMDAVLIPITDGDSASDGPAIDDPTVKVSIIRVGGRCFTPLQINPS